MKLQDRDYTSLTPEEQSQWDHVKAKRSTTSPNGLTIQSGSICGLPKAVRHYESLFPNNYLDPCELGRGLAPKLAEFESLLKEQSPSEREVLRFLRDEDAHFVVASILHAQRWQFGHHDAYAFPEFAIGSTYKADYLLVGKGSGGWGLVFVELEAPTGRTSLRDGSLGESFRKGIKQVEEWDRWMQGNYQTLQPEFEKHFRLSHNQTELPKAFRTYDKTRLKFVVVAGRREDFTEKTYRIRREKESKSLLLHYDNLVDYARVLLGPRGTY